MKSRLFRIVRGFAITIVIVLIFGLLFNQYTGTLPEDQQDDVLLLAIPFVAVFVSIILAFICLIVVVAVIFDGKVPPRSYRPIENILIAGILLGVVGLFQGWTLFAYVIGFVLLLLSLIGFMIWSHFGPMTPRQSSRLLPLSQRAHVIGAVIAVAVWALIALATITSAQPQEPYGHNQALWNFKSDEEQAEISAEAEGEYRNATIPLLALVSLMPAGIVYYGTREVAAALAADRRAVDPSIQSVSVSSP